MKPLAWPVACSDGAGAILVFSAIEPSRQESFKGSIGLHLLPQVYGFYANKAGMTRPARFAAVQAILRNLSALGDGVWVASRRDIATHFRALVAGPA